MFTILRIFKLEMNIVLNASRVEYGQSAKITHKGVLQVVNFGLLWVVESIT